MMGRQFTLSEVQERFWAKVDKNDPNGCWLWTGALFTQGYGSVSIWRKVKKTHRVAWEWIRGPIPTDGDWTIDHLCNVKRCVNPDHMEIVTRSENSHRGGLRRYQAGRTQTCRNGHPREFGQRSCRACRNLQERRWRVGSTNSGIRLSAPQERARIGRFLSEWRKHGFSSLDEALAYVWPDLFGERAA